MLFFVGGPATVLFAIIAVVINPVDGGLFFAKLFYMQEIGGPHILLELFKRLPDNPDAPTPIVMVSHVFWSVASIAHTAPDRIETRFSHPMSAVGVHARVTSAGASEAEAARGMLGYLSASTATLPKNRASILSLPSSPKDSP